MPVCVCARVQSLLDDAKVNKGTSLEFLTQFCKEFLNRDPIEELDTLFKRARLDDKMLNFFPQQKRSIDHFNAYFTESGLKVLVDLNKKRFSDAQLRNLAAELKMLIQEEGTVKDALELVGSKIEELKLDEKDVLPVLWTTIMDSVQVRNAPPRTALHCTAMHSCSSSLSLSLSSDREDNDG